MKKYLWMMVFAAALASCNSNSKESKQNAAASGWTPEQKKKQFDDCMVSLTMKEENNKLPDETKKAVCDCMVEKNQLLILMAKRPTWIWQPKKEYKTFTATGTTVLKNW